MPVSATQDDAETQHNYSLDDVTIKTPAELRRAATGTAIGNFTEWYDFGLYSFVIPYMSHTFFPKDSGMAVIGTFAGLAASFVVRPLGGIFCGLLGDRIGRRGVLMLTVSLMALGTFLLGLLPGYETIGVMAPLLLFVIRGMQGFSAGGEYVSAITFLSEHAPDKKRGLITSFLPMGTVFGYLLSAAFVAILSSTLTHEQMASWGWRIPFITSLPLGLIGLYLRLRVEESPAYENQAADQSMDNEGGLAQLYDTVVQHWPSILVVAGLTIGFNVTNYMLTGYLPTYLTDVLSITETAALTNIILVLLMVGLTVSMLSIVGDRIGKRPILAVGSLLMIIVSVPMFMATLHGDATNHPIWVFLGILPEGLMLVCFMSCIPSTLPGQFPTNVRLGATSISFNLAVSAFGGTTPLIAEALVESTGDLMIPAYMLVGAGVISLVAVYFARDTAGKPMPGSAPVVSSMAEARELVAAQQRA